MKTYSASEFVQQVQDGRIFTVEFIKRTNGEHRVMNCRTGVTAGTVGGSLPYDPAERELLPVYDLKAGFRNVNLRDLVALRLGGQSFRWNTDARRFEECGA